MVPLSFIDNGAVKKYLLGHTGRVFNEKLEGEDREVRRRRLRCENAKTQR